MKRIIVKIMKSVLLFYFNDNKHLVLNCNYRYDHCICVSTYVQYCPYCSSSKTLLNELLDRYVRYLRRKTWTNYVIMSLRYRTVPGTCFSNTVLVLLVFSKFFIGDLSRASNWKEIIFEKHFLARCWFLKFIHNHIP